MAKVYPIGVQNFAKTILYVDKTGYIEKLIKRLKPKSRVSANFR